MTRTSLYQTIRYPRGQGGFSRPQPIVCEHSAASASGGGALNISALTLIQVYFDDHDAA